MRIILVKGSLPLLHKLVIEFGPLDLGNQPLLLLPTQLHLQHFLFSNLPNVLLRTKLYYRHLFHQSPVPLLQHQRQSNFFSLLGNAGVVLPLLHQMNTDLMEGRTAAFEVVARGGFVPFLSEKDIVLFFDALESDLPLLVEFVLLNMVGVPFGDDLGRLGFDLIDFELGLWFVCVDFATAVELIPLFANLLINVSEMLGLSAGDPFGSERWFELLILHLVRLKLYNTEVKLFVPL